MAIRVSNYTIQITTAVATFEMSRPIQDSPDMINYIARSLAGEHKGNVVVYLNGQCKGHYDYFEVPTVPAVWTHCPLPIGMKAHELQAKFEERAASVLGDHDCEVDLSKCSSPDDLYNDHRYWSVTVRAAWMMYVDQAIEQFVAK